MSYSCAAVAALAASRAAVQAALWAQGAAACAQFSACLSPPVPSLALPASQTDTGKGCAYTARLREQWRGFDPIPVAVESDTDATESDTEATESDTEATESDEEDVALRSRQRAGKRKRDLPACPGEFTASKRPNVRRDSVAAAWASFGLQPDTKYRAMLKLFMRPETRCVVNLSSGTLYFAAHVSDEMTRVSLDETPWRACGEMLCIPLPNYAALWVSRDPCE